MTVRDDSGQGGAEALPLGVLTFVVGALLLSNVWAVIDSRAAVTTAAREAARAYVEATDEGRAWSEARARAAEVLVGHGRDPDRLVLRRSTPHFSRCAPVTLEASYRVPALTLPWIGGLGRGITVRATHRELVDPYRSGLAGATSCD